MKSKKKRDFRVECYEVPTINPEPPSSAADTQNPPASVADAASADSAILQKELAAQKDDYLRLAADFDNFQKRTRRDSERQAAAEKEAFIGDLLPVLDSLERALASEKTNSSEPLQQGLTMTLQQVGQLLHRHGIEAVEDLGRPFDPYRHEAVSVRSDSRRPDRRIRRHGDQRPRRGQEERGGGAGQHDRELHDRLRLLRRDPTSDAS